MGRGKAMAVIGIGATSRASVEDVVSAIRMAVRQLEAGRQMDGGECTLTALATLYRAGTNAVLAEAAGGMGLRFLALPVSALAACAGGCITHSAKSMAAYGVPSVAEAAALAGAGAGARLIVPRLCGPNTTASVASAK